MDPDEKTNDNPDAIDDNEEEYENEEPVQPKVRSKKILDDDEEDDEDDNLDDNEEDNQDDNEPDKEIDKAVDKEEEKEEDNDNDEDDDEDEDDDDDDDDDEDNEDDKEDDNEDNNNQDKDSDGQEEDDDEEDEEVHSNRPGVPDNTIYDFDIMMARKKEENSRKRKRRNYDIINDNDDIIDQILNDMRAAVETDNEANKNRQAATKKLKLLPFIVSQLRKVDLRDAFLDSDVLYVISEWLNPLPDRSLPHLQIRENLLKILLDFNLSDVDRIKSSGIGKSIMYLFKHPKETKENKQRAKELISLWSRPIFQLETNFNSISREEREKRDLDLQARQKKKIKARHNSITSSSSNADPNVKPAQPEVVPAKPGDKGWIPRARVPAPSMRDYVIRPESKTDLEIGKKQKSTNMLDKYFRTQQERRRAGKQQRAVNMKIDRI